MFVNVVGPSKAARLAGRGRPPSTAAETSTNLSALRRLVPTTGRSPRSWAEGGGERWQFPTVLKTGRRSGHSLGCGFVTEAFRADADAHSTMRQTGQKDPKISEVYARGVPAPSPWANEGRSGDPTDSPEPSADRPLESADPRRKALGAVRLQDIRHTQMQQWVSRMTRAGSGATTVVRAYGGAGVGAGRRGEGPAVRGEFSPGDQSPRKNRKPHVYLPHRQLQDLALAAGEYSTVVLTLGYCGLRWGEMAALRVQDLNLRLLAVARNAVGLNGHVAVGTRSRTTSGQCRYRAFLVALLAQRCEAKDRNGLVLQGASARLRAAVERRHRLHISLRTHCGRWGELR